MRRDRVVLGFIGVLSGLTALVGVQSCVTRAPASSGESGKREVEAEEEDEENEEEEREAQEHPGEPGEVAIELAEAPAPVQAAIAKLVGSGKIGRVTRESDEGVTSFEVEYTLDGGERSADLSESGDIVELERKIPASGLPRAVANALSKKFPGATIGAAESVEAHYFELAITVDGKKHRIEVSPAGEIH